MASFPKKVMKSLPPFEKFELTQIPRIDNVNKDSELLKVVPIEQLS